MKKAGWRLAVAIVWFVAAGVAAPAFAGDGAPAVAATNAVKHQTMCPVMKDNPVNKNLFVDVAGKRIYVCCKGCIGAITRDPDKFIKQMEADGVVLETAPVKPPAKTE